MGNFKPTEDIGGGYFDSGNTDGEQTFKTARGAASDLSRRRFAEYLAPGETRELIRAYRAGDPAAGDRLIWAYARLVRSCAKGIHGPATDDVIAAGMVGLATALRCYPLSRDSAF